MNTAEVTLGQARGAWLTAQGLCEPVGGSLWGMVAATGWLRTLGGAEAYLALRARRPGVTVVEVNAALQSGELRVTPCARGCMYAVPAAQAPWGIRFAASLARKRMLKELAKAGVTPDERERLAARVLAELTGAPRSTDGLRASLKGEIRSLGELGKKIGISSPLPSVLRLLEFDGGIERRPITGLDSERYEWRVGQGDPFADVPDEADTIALTEGMLRFWLPQAGPATLDEFAEWSGASKKDARAAAERVGVRSVTVAELGPAMMIPGGALPAQEPDPEHVAFLGSMDNYVANRMVARHLVAPGHLGRPASRFGSGDKPFAEGGHASGRFVVRGGLLVGLWEYDPDAKLVRWGTWKEEDRRASMQSCADDLGAMLATELGHGMVFSLDNVEDQRGRLGRVP